MSEALLVVIPLATTAMTALIGFLCKTALTDRDRRIEALEADADDLQARLIVIETLTAERDKTKDKIERLLEKLK